MRMKYGVNMNGTLTVLTSFVAKDCVESCSEHKAHVL